MDKKIPDSHQNTGAVYGLYKGDTLIDSFTTDENGQFTTGYYVCDSDWTVREISPSEGYLLDSTIHKRVRSRSFIPLS